MSGVSVQNLTRRRSVPRFAYGKVANAVLPGWDISLVFVGEARAKALNQKLRRKSYTPNVLSYVAGTKSGEVIICPAVAERQAPRYKLSTANYVLFLFIHALLHVKGWVHGGTMEKREHKLLAQFALNGGTPSGDRRSAGVAKSAANPLPNETKNRNRNRHRHVPGKDGRRRRSR